MLSYQHAYHAGNLADVHKHALLAVALDYLTRKDKPLSYLETHAGRGLYDLSDAPARKTGEAAQGIARAEAWFGSDHPYARALAAVRAQHGDTAYPGSPLIAQTLLRPGDRMHLAELHPQEHAALRTAVRGRELRLYRQDGLEMAQSLCPPEPRRGLILLDPSWEVKSEYATLPRVITALARKWNVGIVMLWYPLLADAPHAPMLAALMRDHPDALRHEVRFPPVRKGHRMVGSGLFVLNPPWGLDRAATELDGHFKALRG
ncbi:23S rRNA (adenine(2030)-N(6))-methyltransferase RlmJ [Pseudoponticoccus marisrubri]|uniref:Ribosomal RNA large subunit methyltransferase J n=1 Tax=Pseudoponticoccus marisrubri TaxID=1685382 RepID=A0A0W7WKS5_9RHOB|nr:23S rRNA (adenine(2030)-N(6))-methyltransferase RlmJ [Pseudoponticoccus marisrubri]KUF11219.1 protein involved in catabolism of external DNA [Pseudoponticoccus marisrubri]